MAGGKSAASLDGLHEGPFVNFQRARGSKPQKLLSGLVSFAEFMEAELIKSSVGNDEGLVSLKGKPLGLFFGRGLFLVGGKLLAYLRDKLRTNELGGALAPMTVTEQVERSMLLRADRIHALASRLLAGGILLG